MKALLGLATLLGTLLSIWYALFAILPSMMWKFLYSLPQDIFSNPLSEALLPVGNRAWLVVGLTMLAWWIRRRI